MTHPTVIKLHDGNLMPQLGLGVWKAGNEEVVSAIHKALEVGYRSFDTAAAYQNEAGVGNALHSAGVNRDELFITTKLWNDDQKRPHEALKESLQQAEARLCGSLLNPLAGAGDRPLRRSLAGADRAAAAGAGEKHRRV